jgi:glutathione S-transferase
VQPAAFIEEQAMESGIELYSAPVCPFSHRTRLTLAEKGLQARIVDIDLRNKPPAFLALTPLGEVPVLKVGEDSLWDCAVIDEYLEDTFPQPALLPPDPVERARARAWIRFADRRLYADTKRLLLAPDADARGAAMAAVREDLRFMQQHAFEPEGAGPFWMGAQLTLVDLTFIPWFEQSAVLERLLGFTWPPGTEGLRRWYDFMVRRPSVGAQGRPAEFYLHEYGKWMNSHAGSNGAP